MFKTISIKIDLPSETYLALMRDASLIFDIHTKWCFENKTWSKKKAHADHYFKIREQFPHVPSALVQSIRDTALESVKATKLKCAPKSREFRSLRLNKRLITLRGKQVTICGAERRTKTVLHIPQYFENLYNTGKFKSATLVYRKKKKEFWIQLSMEIEPASPLRGDAIGVDRGIKNIATLSNGTLISGKPISKIQRKYLYNRTTLQKKGTRSSKRRLRRMGSSEQRFIRDMNHVVTKKLAAMPYSTFVLEKLKKMSKKNRGKVLNKRISGWSYYQFEQFLNYKLEEQGKSMVFINPAYTSQDCSCCGHRDKESRIKSLFKCTVCGYAAHADINAAKNILAKHLSAQSAEQGTVNCPDAISCSVKTVQPFASLAL